MTNQHKTSKFAKKALAKFAMILAMLSLSLPLSVIGSAAPAANLLALTEQANFRFLISTAVTLGDFTDQDREFTFNAPGVDRTKDAVLLLRAQGVQCPNNTMTINGTAVQNVLQVRDLDELDDFHSEIGRVPANVLNATGNTLRIASGFCIAPDRDEFTVDNVVLIYHQP